MLKTLLSLLAMVPPGLLLGQADFHAPHVRHPGGDTGATPEATVKTDIIKLYKSPHEAAMAAFQAAYSAGRSSSSRARGIRLFLVSLKREPGVPKSVYDLGILCAQDGRWDDALKFQREAQRLASADPEVAGLTAAELARIEAIVDLESSPEGHKRRLYDIALLQAVDRAKDPVVGLGAVKGLEKLDATRWEAPALAGILHAQLADFPNSLKAFEEAAHLAPPTRRQQLQSAADIARKETNFVEQVRDADALWEKQQYGDAARHYATAWENSPGRLETGMQAATAYLMADQVTAAVEILSRMRDGAPVGTDTKIVAMLRELGAVSDDAKHEASRSAGATAGDRSTDAAARLRVLVGKLTTPRMELAAKPDPPLLDDRTSFIPITDDEITEGHNDIPFLSAESIYALYQRDVPAPPSAPLATPGTPAAPAVSAPPPAVDLTKPAAPPASVAAEPAPPSLPQPRQLPPGAGQMVSVTTDPPGASITFNHDSTLTCVTPCQMALPPGKGENLKAALNGYHDELRLFDVEKGKKSALNITLIRRAGTVSVDSQPPGAAIYLDGNKTDSRTPARLRIPEGDHVLAVEIDGKLSEQKITVADGGLSKVAF